MVTRLKYLYFIISLCAIVVNIKTIQSKTAQESLNEDMFLDTVEVLIKYGYTAEKHKVKTEDGYILELHRCLPKNKINKTKHNMPVFVMHGLGGSSYEWTIIGPGKSLIYLLSDEGFDVWMGNARGNIYSSNHVKLDPENSSEFWNYSWNEIGFYDVPASIDYVLGYTNLKKLHYIGHSQGTTSFLVMCSSKPEYNEKIVAANILAPAAFMSNSELIIKFAFAFNNPILSYLRKYQSYKVSSKNPLVNYPMYLLCNANSTFISYCEHFLFMLFGPNNDDKLLNKTLIPLIMSHAPSGNSILQIIHYGQSMISGKFRRFDFGVKENYKKYGTKEPPDYPLDKVIVPIAIHWGASDTLTAPEDIKKLRNLLPNVIMYRKVPVEGFNHIDFLIGNDVKKLLYDKILDVIFKYDDVVK